MLYILLTETCAIRVGNTRVIITKTATDPVDAIPSTKRTRNEKPRNRKYESTKSNNLLKERNTKLRSFGISSSLC